MNATSSTRANPVPTQTIRGLFLFGEVSGSVIAGASPGARSTSVALASANAGRFRVSDSAAYTLGTAAASFRPARSSATVACASPNARSCAASVAASSGAVHPSASATVPETDRGRRRRRISSPPRSSSSPPPGGFSLPGPNRAPPGPPGGTTPSPPSSSRILLVAEHSHASSNGRTTRGGATPGASRGHGRPGSSSGAATRAGTHATSRSRARKTSGVKSSSSSALSLLSRSLRSPLDAFPPPPWPPPNRPANTDATPPPRSRVRFGATSAVPSGAHRYANTARPLRTAAASSPSSRAASAARAASRTARRVTPLRMPSPASAFNALSSRNGPRAGKWRSGSNSATSSGMRGSYTSRGADRRKRVVAPSFATTPTGTNGAAAMASAMVASACAKDPSEASAASMTSWMTSAGSRSSRRNTRARSTSGALARGTPTHFSSAWRSSSDEGLRNPGPSTRGSAPGGARRSGAASSSFPVESFPVETSPELLDVASVTRGPGGGERSPRVPEDCSSASAPSSACASNTRSARIVASRAGVPASPSPLTLAPAPNHARRIRKPRSAAASRRANAGETNEGASFIGASFVPLVGLLRVGSTLSVAANASATPAPDAGRVNERYAGCAAHAAAAGHRPEETEETDAADR